MTESEKQTRKRRIDPKLKRLGWVLTPFQPEAPASGLTRHAVEEYPTPAGPADYAIFVNGALLGILEAKKVSTGVENVMEQAKRYAKAVVDTIGSWRGYQVPFLYSTNGETICSWDARHGKSLPQARPSHLANAKAGPKKSWKKSDRGASKRIELVPFILRNHVTANTGGMAVVR